MALPERVRYARTFIHSPFHDVDSVLVFQSKVLKNQVLRPRSVLLWMGLALFAMTRPCLSTARDVPLPVDFSGNVVPHTFILCYQYFPSCHQVINMQHCHSKLWGTIGAFPPLFADVVWRSITDCDLGRPVQNDVSLLRPAIASKETPGAAASSDNLSMVVSYVSFHITSISLAPPCKADQVDSSKISLFKEGMC